MIPLSVGEVKSCLVVAVGRLPAWSLPPITHLPASLLACSCQGSLRKVIFQKSQYLKKSCFRLAQNTGAEGSLLPSSFFLACPRMWQQPMASSRARGLVPFVTVVSWAICSCSSRAELLPAYGWGGETSWKQQPDPSKRCFSLEEDNEYEARCQI